MATYVKGSAVTNATSYELFENSDGTYTSLATGDEINFEVSALGLAAGDHILVVKAHADGYNSSAYSNAVTYTVEGSSSDSGEDETITVSWSVYSSDGVATVTVEDDCPVVSCTTGKSVVLVTEVGGGFSFTAPVAYGSDGGKMVVIGIYSTNVLAIRVRGSGTGTQLQRYGYESFSGAALSTDSSATTTFAAGDTLAVVWSGDTASLYVNGTLQSSFDCSSYTSATDWKKCAGWLETSAKSSTFTLANFTLA